MCVFWYNFVMQKTNIYKTDYTAYQPYMLFDFTFSFEKDVPQDDICRIVIEIAEEVNLNMYVDFSYKNSYGYDGVMMFKLFMLAKAEYGYASTRDIAHLCRTDVRYMFIAQNQINSLKDYIGEGKLV